MSALPNGWRRISLKDVCDVSPRDPSLPRDAPFVPMACVEVGQRFPTGYELRGSRGGVRARANDVLFARITPCLENGKLAQLPADAPPTGGSTEFIVIRPGLLVEPAFLYYWCQEPSIRADAQSMMSGATGRMRLSGRDLGEFVVDLPPAAVQRRIVEILEDHLSHLDAAEASLSVADRRRESWASAALDEIISESSGGSAPLASMVDRIEAGRSFGGPAPAAADIEWGIIKVSAMTWGEFRPGENKRVSADRANPAFEIKAGDLLVSRANTSAYVGAPVFVRETRPRLLLSDKSLRLVPRHGVDPEWLAVVLASRSSRRQVSRIATGTSDSMRNISQGNLLSITVPHATTIQQASVIETVRQSTAAAARLSGQIEAARHRSAALRRSLLAAAFSGRLTGRSSDTDIIEELASA